jgi:hypothetical protein
MPLTISTLILLLNSLWDLLSSLSIYFLLHFGRCTPLANTHLALWTDEADRRSYAASAVMAALLLQWSLVRGQGALSGPRSDAACVDASATYVLEAVMVGLEVVAGRMHGLAGWGVVVLCVVCWGVVMRECLEEGL